MERVAHPVLPRTTSDASVKVRGMMLDKPSEPGTCSGDCVLPADAVKRARVRPLLSAHHPTTAYSAGLVFAQMSLHSETWWPFFRAQTQSKAAVNISQAARQLQTCCMQSASSVETSYFIPDSAKLDEQDETVGLGDSDQLTTSR